MNSFKKLWKTHVCVWLICFCHGLFLALQGEWMRSEVLSSWDLGTTARHLWLPGYEPQCLQTHSVSWRTDGTLHARLWLISNQIGARHVYSWALPPRILFLLALRTDPISPYIKNVYKNTLKLQLFLCSCICVYMCATVCVGRSEDSSWQLGLSFHGVGPGSWTEVVK